MAINTFSTGKTDTMKRPTPFPIATDALPDPTKRMDNLLQEPHVTTARYILRDRFGHLPNVLVAAEAYLCLTARSRRVVPDLLVAFDVPANLAWARNGYVIEEMRKPPDFVLEVASRTTGSRDSGDKRAFYQYLSVKEQWEFDWTGGSYHGHPLSGFVLVGRVYAPIELTVEPDGMIWGHSKALGLDICWVNGRLRFRDPLTGRFLQEYEEVKDERDVAEARADTAEARADTAEARADTAEAERDREMEARLRAEAELERLRRLLDGS